MHETIVEMDRAKRACDITNWGTWIKLWSLVRWIKNLVFMPNLGFPLHQKFRFCKEQHFIQRCSFGRGLQERSLEIVIRIFLQ